LHGRPRPPPRAPWKRTSSLQRGRRGSHPNPAPPTTAPGHSLHAPFGYMVLPNAAVRTPRVGIAEGMRLPAVVGVPPPIGAPINRCGPAGRLAWNPWRYAPRNLPLRHTAVFAADVTATQRATWDAVVGTPTSDAARVRTTLPLSEGGYGVTSSVNSAPVARLAGVMQFLPQAEPMLGCHWQLVVPLATEKGLLDAPNARLPPDLEPLTCNVELPDGDVRRQHWWPSRVTQAKAAALLEASNGTDVPRLKAQRTGKAGGWFSAPPDGGPGHLPHEGPLFHAAQVAPGGALASSRLRGQTVPPVQRTGRCFRRPRRVMLEIGIWG